MVKLFFDSFSVRLSSMEDRLSGISLEAQTLRAASETSQISDIVLLERLQKLEAIMVEALTWVKRVAEAASKRALKNPSPEQSQQTDLRENAMVPGQLGLIVASNGNQAPLSSATTSTELHVLSLLDARGPMSSPEIGKVIGRSREHSARLMRKLYDEGYVRRDGARIPFKYELVDRVRQSFKAKQSSSEPAGQEAVPHG